MRSIGLIETKGFVGLVEAANAMAHVAEVELVHYEKIGDGMVTIVVRGPLEEVRRAVRTGVAAAQRVGELVSAHVLPRIHPKADRLLPLGGTRFAIDPPDGTPSKRSEEEPTSNRPLHQGPDGQSNETASGSNI
ncbi:MAG: BMC domain-containing protein [Deltaproteobacteria bacterium]|nr:BMC domain-containing protein [Deltaproteobacteria bacterium]